MAIRCPKCSVPSLVADVGAAGRMVRCGHCRTRWLARVLDGDACQRAVAGPVTPEPDAPDAIVIDHVGPGFSSLARPVHPKRPPSDHRGLKALGVLFAVVVGIVVLRAPLVVALPQEATGRDRLAFRMVRSETVRLKGVSTLFVEGEVVNRSAGDVALPAIRVSLKSSAGDEVSSWLVEPSASGLAPGRSIGFRSVLASPPEAASQVTLSLAERQGGAIGFR